MGGTLAGNALSMAAVRATLSEVLTDEEMQRMDALDRGERLGDWLDPAFEWDKTAA